MGPEAAGEHEQRPPARSRRLLWALAAVLAVVLAAGALAGALRDPVTLPEGTPERTVQDYIQAVFDRDYERATSFFSEAVAERCDDREFRPEPPRERPTVTLDDVDVRDGRAEVTVRLRSDAGEPALPIFESAYPQHFVLIQEDGRWVIDEDPWPLYFCDGIR